MASFAQSLRVIAFLVLFACMVSCEEDTHNHASHKKRMPRKEKVTRLHFYFHDIVAGENVTAVNVVKASQTSSMTGFGMVNVMDDPLTEGPEPDSKIFGYAQGLYSAACKREVRLLMAASLVFQDGKYNGSTLSLLGNNAVLHDVREMPIVGGSGMFRLARGYAQARTHYLDAKTGNAVVKYNVTVFHY